MATNPPPVKCTRCGELYSSYAHQCNTAKEQVPDPLEAATCSADYVRSRLVEAKGQFRERIAHAESLGWTECDVVPDFSGWPERVDCVPVGNPPVEGPWFIRMPKCELPNSQLTD